MSSSKRYGVYALLFCMALIIGVPPSPAQQQSEQMQVVIASEQMVNEGNPDGALAEVQKLIEEFPDFAPAYFVAALAYRAKGQPKEAYESFILAANHQPGWGDAHREASRSAADMGDLEASWDQAILAHQEGTDMTDAFEALPTMAPAPEDLDMRLAAYRVWVAPMNVEPFLAAEENPFGRVADSSNDSTNTANRTSSKATSVGARVVSDSAGDRAGLMRMTTQRLDESPNFGVVARQEMAQYIVLIEVDTIGELEQGDRERPLEGYLRLLDAQSGDQAYRYRLRLSDIIQQGVVTREMDRIINLMEEWAIEQQR